MPDGTAAPRPDDEPALPSWNLADLYPGPDSAELAADLDRSDQAAQDFAATHATRLAAMSGAELAGAIDAYQAIEEVLGRVISYAQLLFSGDSSSSPWS
jgi:oligoendopeptidase F